jgi:hypothetical protein
MTGVRATILAAFADVGSLFWFQALKPHRARTPDGYGAGRAAGPLSPDGAE